MLIVGAGEVGFEKMSFILKSSPDANITLVAPEINPEITELLAERTNHNVTIKQRKFRNWDVRGNDLVVAATNIKELNLRVRKAAKRRRILVNVADTPDQCDFYLGSIVTRGNLKVAISTNGQSPTFAKRFRQMLEATLPEESDELLDNLNKFRNQLEGDFNAKVKALNEVTASLVE